MFNARFLLAAAVFAALAACAPETKQPVQVMALVRQGGGSDGPGGHYGPAQVTLTTVDDLVGMKGSIGHLVGGAKIVVDPDDPLLRLNNGALTDDVVADIFVKNEGGTPRGNFVQKDGVFWPSDFHTWNMVTAYYNVEQAFLYFQDVGVPAQTLADLRIFYFPAFTLTEVSHSELRDNAMFFAPLKSLLVLPFDQLQEAPLPMNSWVVAHEYSHVVFNREVYGGAGFPVPLVQWSTGFASTPQANTLKALDEGLADFHAFAASCRTDFGCDTRGLESSLTKAEADRRDMALSSQCMTPSLQHALDTLPVGEFTAGSNEYAVGTVIASALYHAGASPEDWTLLSKSVLATYPQLNELITSNLETPENFTLTAVVDLILQNVTSTELQTRLCGQFLDRLELTRDVLHHCPAQSTPAGACP